MALTKILDWLMGLFRRGYPNTAYAAQIWSLILDRGNKDACQTSVRCEVARSATFSLF